MVDRGSCAKVSVTIRGRRFDPISYGSETHHAVREQFRYQHPDETPAQIQKRFDNFMFACGLGVYHKPEDTCRDCGVRIGGYHHRGCDTEECPKCHLQLIGCDCHKGEQ